MRCLLHFWRSTLIFATLLSLSLMLRGLRACSPAFGPHSAVIPNNEGCTVVFWPDKADTLWPRQVSLPMSTDGLSIWWLALWKHSRTWASHGNLGVADGIPQTRSTSNFSERPTSPSNNPPHYRLLLSERQY